MPKFMPNSSLPERPEYDAWGQVWDAFTEPDRTTPWDQLQPDAQVYFITQMGRYISPMMIVILANVESLDRSLRAKMN